MKKAIKLSLIIGLMLSIFLTGCGNNGTDETQPGDADNKKDVELTLGVTPWTTTIPPTYVAKQILEDMGYEIRMQNADVGVVFTGLSKGDIDIFMDAWLPDMHRNYMEKYGDKLEDVAVSYTEGDLGWVTPEYVEIDSIEDIKGNEDLFDGKIYGIEEGAGMTITSRKMIEEYGLDLEYVASGEPAMMAEAKRKIANNEPILFLGWRPHPMFVNWDLKVLEDPKVFYKTSEVHIIVSSELKEKAPEAYEFLSNWKIPIGDVEEMILKLDEGATEEEIAKEWIENNQDKVNQMVGK